MPIARDTVEDHACNFYGWIMGRKPPQQCGGRLSLRCDVDDQNDGQAEAARQIRSGAGAAWGASNPVKKAHDAFHNNKIGVSCGLSRIRASSSPGGIDQLSKLTAAMAGRALMKGRVDIVRTRLGGVDREAAPPQSRKQGKGQRGLPSARLVSSDDETGTAHWVPA